MNVLLRVLLSLNCFLLGVLLVFLPWSGVWERNYFLNHYPTLVPFLLNPSLRGAISGLGLLDIGVAAGLLWRRRAESLAARN